MKQSASDALTSQAKTRHDSQREGKCSFTSGTRVVFRRDGFSLSREKQGRLVCGDGTGLTDRWLEQAGMSGGVGGRRPVQAEPR